jgi:hypothetical protein
MAGTEAPPMSSGRGDFFAVDRGAWNIAVARGLNPAIAFLVLARGSAGDNQTTSWSIHSVEKYTGISRPRAVAAIENLLDSGILRMLDAGEITSRIAAGIIRRAPRRGCPAYNIGPDRGQEGGGAALIWLPNALVDGVKSAPVPPLELIRQTQNVGALKALIALYAAHDLKNCGGVSWRAIRRTFTRERVAESRGFVVWCFKGTPEATVFWNRAPSVEFMTGTKIGGCDTGKAVFWESLTILLNLGLAAFVAHLVDADSDEGEIIMPIDSEHGEDGECQLAIAARNAATRLLGPHGQAIADRHGGILGPVRPHLAKVQAVGVLRLLYRPKNFITSDWLGASADWAIMAAAFDAIAPEVDVEAWRNAG